MAVCVGLLAARRSRRLSAIIVIALLLLLLYGGDRLAIVGRGLAEGVRTFRKTLRESQQPAKPPPRSVIVTQSEPKLLPAKGETSGGDQPEDDERR